MKYKNFIILLALICVWTSFFWVYKYFFWWLLKENLSLTLEQIAWYLALGSFFAYLFWSFIYTLLKEQWSVICASFWVIMILSLWYLKWFTSIDSIAIISIWVWFFYGYWGVLKNIVISQEIEYTGKSDTFINGFANIAFFVSIIIGSIAWWKLAESLHTDGVFWIFIIMVFAILLWTSIKQSGWASFKDIGTHWKDYIKNYFPNFLTVIKSNVAIMLISSMYLVVATILSQKSIEYSVMHLWKTGSQASFLLLYSAIWTILGNLLTMKIHKRWQWASTLTLIFALLIFVFPFMMKDFFVTSILATLAWFFFGTNYNLCESYLLLKIGKQGKRDYGAASYGIVSSVCLFWCMFLTFHLEKMLWFQAIFILWGSVIVFISFILHFFQNDL